MSTRREAMLRAQAIRANAMRWEPGKKKAKLVWRDMQKRCYNAGHKHFARYGGRGIKVCERWSCFDLFFEDMGVPPAGLSLDRIENDGHYHKENCRWATRQQQARNKSTNVFVEFGGERLTVQDWANRVGTGHTNLRRRLKLWGVEDALTTPVTKSNHTSQRTHP